MKLNNIKLVCIDVDGTLANTDKHISIENKKALKLAHENGIHVVIASGRTLVSLHSIFEEIHLPKNCICLSGGYASIEEKELVYEPFAKEKLKCALNIILASRVNAVFSTPLFSILPERWKDQTEGIGSKKDFIVTSTLEEYKELILEYQEKIVKITVMEYEQAAYQQTRAAFHNLDGFNVAMSDVGYLDITNKGSTKGSALKEVAKYFNVELEDILCIGDNENDLEMMKVSGFSIAMDNAHDSVKKIANAVTDDNDHSGVAQAIYKYLI